MTEKSLVGLLFKTLQFAKLRIKLIRTFLKRIFYPNVNPYEPKKWRINSSSVINKERSV